MPMISDIPRRSWVEQIMGMPISVLARGPATDSLEAHAAVAAVFAELRHVDAMFSTYRSDSAVSRLGRGEILLDVCPVDVREVAGRCQQARALTGGLFDATRPDGAWDPSGYVKGWAVQRAGRHLATVDVDWCLNAGGDVLVCCGGGRTFNVGIADPRNANHVATVLARGSGGVATSGGSVRGAHLYDPRTGGPAAERWASVTVAGPSLETADLLATAGFVAGAGWAAVVALLPGYSGFAIAPDGSQVATPGWPTRSCVR